ncbi:TonB-dependent receptor domain-containing protein [Pedobacter xixiisoli]|uniref:Outer membrane receptor proteins, mostly Fe transport n=1 Tax=Pedobacter xixiisoli TaxID=1476464 RepID=A0A286AE68_9SPHI|nr:outer membrane beta-barrel family protein [Pedobacter xixiisoli]SOD20186.1 Outer membrane receptor proteins, mostly Fe transport [Pedobacter xixiisoli]
MDRIKRKFLLLAAVFCITTVKIYAQSGNTGKISGKIVDAQTNETIPYASAILTDRKTKAAVRTVQSDLDGNFTIPSLPNGVYTFKASYIGYQTMVRDSISITGALKSINLGTIKMKTGKGNILNEVVVTSQKPTMQLGIDKKVFSVDQSVVSEGGSATDVLQNVPSVQTDMNGGISLRGSNARVLIDGKQSLIGGGDVAQILASIPASSIESIEVITNPSSKYDAEGQTGIINIVLKKNKKLGLNGTVALTAGNRDNYNAATNLAFQNKNVNLYANYSYRYGNRPGSGFNNTIYQAAPRGIGFVNQSNTSNELEKGHNIKLGMDYNLTEKSTVSISGGFNVRNSDEVELLNFDEYTPASAPINLSSRTNTRDRDGNNYDLSLDFVQKLKKKGEELTFNASYATGSNDTYQLFDTDRYFENGAAITPLFFQQRTVRPSDNKNYNIQLDYMLPLTETSRIEAGYRTQFRTSDSRTIADSLINNVYEFSRYLSNDFNSEDYVHAVYLNYQNQIKNFGYQLGLRGEDAALETEMGAYDANRNLNYTPGRVAYRRLYPSIFLTQKLKNEQQLQLSYSRRVNRPRGWDTNPFLDVSDPINQRQGNVNLMPEDVHAFEFSYSRFFKKFSLVSSVYYRQTNDVIQRIRYELEGGVNLTIPQNLTSATNSGVELIGKFDVSKKWNLTSNFNLYHRKIEGVAAFGTTDVDGLTYNANITNNFTLPYNITLQLRADYRSNEVTAQGTFKAMYGFDAGAKMDLMNKKASLSFNIRNLFNTRKFQMEYDTRNAQANTGSFIEFSRMRAGNMGSLTFSYRFGKTDFSQKKRKVQEAPRSDEESF